MARPGGSYRPAVTAHKSRVPVVGSSAPDRGPITLSCHWEGSFGGQLGAQLWTKCWTSPARFPSPSGTPSSFLEEGRCWGFSRTLGDLHWAGGT